jgi:hypothetical protein
MRHSDILQGAALIVAIATGLAQTSPHHGSLILYLGYGIALFLFAIALVISNRELAKPRIVAVRYDRDKPGERSGLIVENEADSSAFNVSIPDNEIPIGDAWLIFSSNAISRLTKENGRAVIEAWIKQSPRVTVMGGGLFDEMVRQTVVELTVSIVYKDGDNRWYKSVCKIERDIHAPGGLRTEFVRQRRIWRRT